MREFHTLHLGYRHGFIGNPRGFTRDAKATYEDLSDGYDAYVPYLQGDWRVEADSVQSCMDDEGYVALLWEGDLLRVVASSENISRLYIESDANDLSRVVWGSDVREEEGRLYVDVQDKKQYEIIAGQTDDLILIKFIPAAAGMNVYEFIF